MGASNAGDMEKSRFTSISLCLRNDTKYIVTMERQQELVCDLSNGPFQMTFNDSTQISRSRYLTLTVSETVRDRDIVTMEY